MAKLHILFPRKLSGVAAAIEIACASSSDMPATVTSSSRMASANRNATTLMAKKRGAWDSGRPAPARNVQWRFPQKVFDTTPTHANLPAARGGKLQSPTHNQKTKKVTAETEPTPIQKHNI